MDVFLYILFGFFDVIAILVLIYKMFRFPLEGHIFKLTVIGCTLSVVSYIDRFWLNIAFYDMAIQFSLYVIFFRYLIKIRLFESLSVVSIGYCGFVGVQFIVYPLLLASNIVTINDAQGLTNLGTHIIQFSTDVACYAIGFLLYRFNMGFSYIFAPPHDIFIRNKKNKTNTLIIFANTVGIVAVCSTMYWVLNFASAVYIVLPSVLGSLIILIYLSHRRDYDRETF